MSTKKQREILRQRRMEFDNQVEKGRAERAFGTERKKESEAKKKPAKSKKSSSQKGKK